MLPCCAAHDYTHYFITPPYFHCLPCHTIRDDARERRYVYAMIDMPDDVVDDMLLLPLMSACLRVTPMLHAMPPRCAIRARDADTRHAPRCHLRATPCALR